MAPLVSVEDAKHHLRKTSDEEDADIVLKLEQASAIILTYLKMDRVTAIASVSVANPTVITTSVPHSLEDGVPATIAGTTTTPTVNGEQVITVTGTYTFTVPVNVTVGQTAAAGTVGTPGWTDATAPGNVSAAILCVLEDLYERRPIQWDLVGGLLVGLRDPALA